MESSPTQAQATPPARAGRRMLIMLLGVGAFLGLMVGFNQFKRVMIGRALAGKGEPPQTVTAAEAKLLPWQPALTAVGTVRAVRGADLAFEVPGVVVAVTARPGAEASQGQTLVALDDSVESAQLRQLQAVARLAEVTLNRAKEQLAVKAISQAEVDNAEADLAAKQALVQSQAAQLAKKHLTAPFKGRVGIVSVSQGAYLNPGQTVATLQQLDSVYVDFFLPQKDTAQIREGQPVALTVDGFPGRTFQGRVTAVNPKVDSGTRNIQAEATFANPGRSLLPGMFAQVSMAEGPVQQHLTLPQTAITYNPYGAVVFLAVKDGSGLKARQAFVTTGATRGDQVAIVKGLEPGALVVTSGGLKLRNGTPLIVDNRTQPANDADPTPQEQ